MQGTINGHEDFILRKVPQPHRAGVSGVDMRYVTCNLSIGGDHMPASRPSRDKDRVYRERLRRQGLRPIQLWVPDVRSPCFAAEAHRQSLAVANNPYAREDQDFIDAVTDEYGI